VLRHQGRKSKYLQNPVVDDYNIRDDEFYRRANKMKPIGVYSNLEAEWIKRFAWLPKRSDITNQRIWLTHYWEYAIKMDAQGAVPKKNSSWTLIYTREEYITKKLKGEMNE